MGKVAEMVAAGMGSRASSSLRMAVRQVGLLAWLYGSAKRRGPFLVVSPLSTIPNWLREVGTRLPSILKLSARAARARRFRSGP